ncbi:MAG: hypothetical protein FWB71_00405 [Defluviitaleaceae bacterium]|nr:hypothetical protein [Defluviitaleaceae bacterium]
MIQILESHRRMTYIEIAKEFEGKWVFLVEPDETEYGFFYTAQPAVIADSPFEGEETGIYDDLKEKYGSRTYDWTVRPVEGRVSGFFEVARNAN